MDENIITLDAAAKIANVHLTTIRYWCEKYGVGDKVGSKWVINRQHLERIMQARAFLKSN